LNFHRRPRGKEEERGKVNFSLVKVKHEVTRNSFRYAKGYGELAIGGLPGGQIQHPGRERIQYVGTFRNGELHENPKGFME